MTLFGKFLILGKLYLLTLTFIVCIFPGSNLSRVTISDRSVEEYGKCQSKSLIFSIRLFFKYLLSFGPTPFKKDYFIINPKKNSNQNSKIFSYNSFENKDYLEDNLLKKLVTDFHLKNE